MKTTNSVIPLSLYFWFCFYWFYLRVCACYKDSERYDYWCLIVCFVFHLYNDYRGKERAWPKANKKNGKKGKKKCFFLLFGFWEAPFFFFCLLCLVFGKCFFPYIWFLGSVFSFYLVAGKCDIYYPLFGCWEVLSASISGKCFLILFDCWDMLIFLFYC